VEFQSLTVAEKAYGLEDGLEALVLPASLYFLLIRCMGSELLDEDTVKKF
jgi:hypothetical protein